MGELVDAIGNKAEGQLIRSEDWNRLVTEVENVRSELTAALESVRTDLDALAGRVDRIEPVASEFLRVTMQSTRLRYAIGEEAVVTARVTDIGGAEIDFSDPDSRPWVDFVTVWGNFRPVRGFESRGGAGDRTLSVRVNAEGIAQIRVRPDHVEGLTEESESQVALTLEARPDAGQLSIARVLLDAPTPSDAPVKTAFRALTAEYDRPDSVSLRHFTDAYYVHNASLVTGAITPTFVERWRHGWRDYRATILAFVKADADPQTPDHTLGSSSIQLTFRDWIAPWIITDYLPDFNVEVVPLRDKFRPRITNDLGESVGGVRDEIAGFLADKGIVGRLRGFNVVREAVSGLSSETHAAVLGEVSEAVTHAMGLQQSVLSAHVATVGAAPVTNAIDVVLGTTRREGQKSTTVNAAIDSIKASVDSVKEDMRSEVARSVSTKVKELDQPGGRLDTIRSEVSAVDERVRTLGDLGDVQRQLQKVDLVTTRLDNLDRTLIEIRRG